MAKAPRIFKTPFAIFTPDVILGQGGSGRVYRVHDDETGAPFAIKELDPARATTEKTRRFKNEYKFCQRTKHPNIIPVVDAGITEDSKAPFYVMPLAQGSLRELMNDGIHPEAVLKQFGQVLDGVESAHLQSVWHRDLKPENVLVLEGSRLAIADFGVARFAEEELYTLVETGKNTRLANFLYAAPEQRNREADVDQRADIYALGLILNEMFTREIPHGTGYKVIGSVAPQYAYLDDLVTQMLRQSPDDRPASIEVVKRELISRGHEFIVRQRVSELKQTVVPVGDIDDPLVVDPVRIIGRDWDNNVLTLVFQHNITPAWKLAFQNMGSHRALMNLGPGNFAFRDNKASVHVDASHAQTVVDLFKEWLPNANRVYEERLRIEKLRAEEAERKKIREETARQETRANVLRNLKI
jgi:serine/threonine protein kinase